MRCLPLSFFSLPDGATRKAAPPEDEDDDGIPAHLLALVRAL